jgi:hypothetical protein
MMNKQINLDRGLHSIGGASPSKNLTLLQFILRAQQLARQEGRSEQGYGMIVTSIVTILMFSLLAAYLTISNLNRSVSSAYTKSSSTFYAAESGLNARAQLIRQKVGSYAIPTGTSATSINECWNAPNTSPLQYDLLPNGINDFGCKNYTFDSISGTSEDRVTGGNGNSTATQVQIPDRYIATTYVVNNPENLATYPKQATIPTGDLFAGMKMLEYTHRVYATARTQTAGTLGTPARTVLQLDFQTRFVPIFQFAAFYDRDLEITPGPTMNINGRIHTNGDLYLTMGTGNTLCLAGQVSAKGNIYNRRKHAGNPSEQIDNGLVYIYPNSGFCAPSTTQVATNRLENQITYSINPNPNTSDPGNFDSTNRPNMTARFGNTNVLDLVNNINVPAPDFLAKTDGSGNLSTYYTKADLRVEVKSNPAATAIPYSVTSLATGMGNGSTCPGFNVAADRVGSATLRCMKFVAGQLHSLRQPVLVRTGQTTDDNTLCAAELTGVTAATSPAIAALTAADKTKLVRSLQTAIVSQKTLIKYSDITTQPLSNFSDVQTLFGTYLNAAGITTVPASSLSTNKFTEIAAIAGDCFKPAPIQTANTFYNNREGRGIAMLQTNIESLTVWNRDGLYVNLQVDGSGNPQLVSSNYQVLAGGHNNGQGNSATEQIFKFAPIPAAVVTCNATDNLCKASFRHLGLASLDTSESGLVFHLTVDNNNTPGTNTAYTATQSPYGFAITGGKQLPGALTIATDQAAYLQGDYNFAAGTGNAGTGINSVSGSAINPDTSLPWTISELSNIPVVKGGQKFPASILADSLNVASNSCLDLDRQLNCGVLSIKPAGSNTTFLGGSDMMPFSNANNYSGGLHNYPRFHEDWSGFSLNYRGSFVSLGAPLEVSGTWQQTVYSPPNRNWDYDVDFNDVTNLPPLTPNIVYLKQKVFSRGYQN